MKTSDTGAADVLTQADAGRRAARLARAHYAISLELSAGAATYCGDVTIAFDSTGHEPLALDFLGKRILALEVNGHPVEPDWDGVRITLPGHLLTPRTTVHVRYENAYDHGGDGFHQFFDPEDGEEYLYTTFEPYFAHRLFPCVDQPDVKARYEVSVLAPLHWEVIANAPERSRQAAADGRVRHEFHETEPFSTYLVAVVAGPYVGWRSEHDGIPLGLYCRKSLAPFVDADALFDLTSRGLDFFQRFFACRYPFQKYDQVFVPEFNGAAMENVGAVTHNEAYVFRDPPTENQRRRRAEILLHEMAHMWFGNLVTLRWWDDLWLNEAFATYMAYAAMDEATTFTGGWLDFHTRWKAWAYRQDDSPATHPVCGPVRDTDETFLNFDGITYGKGASVLRQLVATLGAGSFRNGLRIYFRRHAYANATLADFLAAMEEASGRDLGQWARAWLETPSLNTIAAQYEVDNGRVASLRLSQRAGAGPDELRAHALEVAVLWDRSGLLELTACAARLDGETAAVPGAAGLPRPALVYPNHGDHGYAKVSLDAVSVRWLRANLDRVEDDLLRQLLWSSAWGMVRDREMTSLDYLELVREMAPREAVPDLLEPVLAQALLALGRFVPEQDRPTEQRRTFATMWESVRAAESDDLRTAWMRALIQLAETPLDVRLLERVSDGIEQVPGFVVDQQMRWDIAILASAHGSGDAARRLAAEAESDRSDRGERMLLKAAASRPLPAAKAEQWGRIASDGFGTLKQATAAMSGFGWSHQREVLEPFVDRFFAEAPAVFRSRDVQFCSDYFTHLFPWYRIAPDTLDRSQQLLAHLGEDIPSLSRMLREANSELERAIRCREFAAARRDG